MFLYSLSPSLSLVYVLSGLCNVSDAFLDRDDDTKFIEHGRIPARSDRIFVSVGIMPEMDRRTAIAATVTKAMVSLLNSANGGVAFLGVDEDGTVSGVNM
jgi:hypothetical protein